MDRALVRNLEQPLALFRVEVSHEVNVALNSIDLAFLCLAVLTILGVNFKTMMIHGHTFLEQSFFVLAYQDTVIDVHGTECGEKQGSTGRRPCIFPPSSTGSVRGFNLMRTDTISGETRGVAAYDYIRGSHAPNVTFVLTDRQSRHDHLTSLPGAGKISPSAAAACRAGQASASEGAFRLEERGE